MKNGRMAALALAGAGLALVCLIAGARAEDCHDRAGLEAEFAPRAAGAPLRLNHGQALFADGLFAASPPASKYPETDDVRLYRFDDHSGAVEFVQGDKACVLGLTPAFVDMLIDLDRGI